ncbi:MULTISPECIES: ATP-binding protein [unclassified Synechococcus]|uniref:ATP-binding protein n=1 Tax=unclassified Synechococcus TaxID=2626047 RepID=UPI001C23F39D|nr:MULTISPECIES: ATP-binding protein [unclassified Synechococcus]
MEIETKYALRLFFPSPAFVQIYFEAVANAIDAGATDIHILIKSDGKIHNPNILEITIQDNGSGFSEEGYERFKRVQEPQDSIHKGLGRIVFLQYFARVDVSSTHSGSRRTFSFVHNFKGDSEVVQANPLDQAGTKLTFKEFSNIRLKSYDDIRPSAIKRELLEQFLPALHERRISQVPLSIKISLSTDESNAQRNFYSDTLHLSPDDLPELKISEISEPTLHFFSKIEVFSAVLTDQEYPLILTAVNIDGRAIPIKILAPFNIPAGTSAIFLFKSDLFGKSDLARQKLILPEGVREIDLFRYLKLEVGRILGEVLPEIRTRNAEVKASFEEDYPHLIGLFDETTVGLIAREEVLETAQKKFFQQQKEIIDSDPTDDDAFQKSLEMSARSLTEYILYRDWVIKRLTSTTPEDIEATLHNLIVPRYKTFDQETLVQTIYRNNAWILDDKFMTFRTILSEASMRAVIAAITLEDESIEDDGRPDISMIFSADPDKAERVDVVVVELKRKKKDDKESTYAGVQLVKRARLLVDHCPNIQRVWYYGIIDIDDDLSQLLQDMGWTPLYSKGKVFYQPFTVKRKSDDMPIPAPTFLMSFSSITEDAAARNHTFLELLKSNFRSQDESSAGSPIVHDASVALDKPGSPTNINSELISSSPDPAQGDRLR